MLFRSRDSHREYEREIERRGVPFYVYKGLGFYDADEIKDLVALVRVLAAPEADLPTKLDITYSDFGLPVDVQAPAANELAKD